MSKFTCEPLSIDGVLLIRTRKFADARGYFTETYSEPLFQAMGIDARFVQDNHSLSTKRGTIRGLHFQTPPRAQAKLVRVARGAIFDVALDLRRGSPAYGTYCSATLSAQGGEQLYIPRGFAHGFCTLDDNCEVIYKVDEIYAPGNDSGLLWSDPDIAIQWPVERSQAAVSDKDADLPGFADFISPF